MRSCISAICTLIAPGFNYVFSKLFTGVSPLKTTEIKNKLILFGGAHAQEASKYILLQTKTQNLKM
jgi:hypothetical protein